MRPALTRGRVDLAPCLVPAVGLGPGQPPLWSAAPLRPAPPLPPPPRRPQPSAALLAGVVGTGGLVHGHASGVCSRALAGSSRARAR